MKKVCTLILLVYLWSCKSKDCNALNHELIDKFEKEMRILKKAHNKKTFKTVKYREALFYLSTTSKIMTRAEYGDIPGYHNDEDYYHDIKVWENWLKENRCLTAATSPK